MAYRIAGNWLGSCSCKMLCACNFGPAIPDQEWCSAAIALEITEGRSDGVDLGGTRAVVALDLPGDFVGGNATARVYLDEAASEEQRRELERILTGKRGGIWEAVAAGVVTEWKPSSTTAIKLSGDRRSVEVAGAGRISLAPITTESGEPTRLVNAPVAAAWNFSGGGTELAFAHGTEWSDPDLRPWKSLGNGEFAQFDWSA